MRSGANSQRLDPVLVPDQFSVARPLEPEDLDRCVTRYGSYPALPAPTGGQWSEYIRPQIDRLHRSRLVSSSTEALDSDTSRYMTHRIAGHARALATNTRSLLTDSPGPYFQPILHDRGQAPEDKYDDIKLPVDLPYVHILPGSLNGSQGPTTTRCAISDIITFLPSNISKHVQGGIDQDAMSSYTSSDDYGAMFEARHGKGAVKNSLAISKGIRSTTFPMTIPSQAGSITKRAPGRDPMTRQIPTYTPSSVLTSSSEPGQIPLGTEHQLQMRVPYHIHVLGIS